MVKGSRMNPQDSPAIRDLAPRGRPVAIVVVFVLAVVSAVVAFFLSQDTMATLVAALVSISAGLVVVGLLAVLNRTLIRRVENLVEGHIRAARFDDEVRERWNSSTSHLDDLVNQAAESGEGGDIARALRGFQDAELLNLSRLRVSGRFQDIGAFVYLMLKINNQETSLYVSLEPIRISSHSFDYESSEKGYNTILYLSSECGKIWEWDELLQEPDELVAEMQRLNLPNEHLSLDAVVANLMSTLHCTLESRRAPSTDEKRLSGRIRLFVDQHLILTDNSIESVVSRWESMSVAARVRQCWREVSRKYWSSYRDLIQAYERIENEDHLGASYSEDYESPGVEW